MTGLDHPDQVARRFVAADLDATPIDSPEEAARLLTGQLQGLDREHCLLVGVDTRHRPLGIVTVSIGSVDHTFMSPREIYRDAVALGASAVLVAHNHPSGNPEPSTDDVSVTRRLVAAGELLGIDLLDHLVVGDHGWTSMARRGQLAPDKGFQQALYAQRYDDALGIAARLGRRHHPAQPLVQPGVAPDAGPADRARSGGDAMNGWPDRVDVLAGDIAATAAAHALEAHDVAAIAACHGERHLRAGRAHGSVLIGLAERLEVIGGLLEDASALAADVLAVTTTPPNRPRR